MDYCLLSFFCKFSIQTHESWRIHVLNSGSFGVPVVNRLKLGYTPPLCRPFQHNCHMGYNDEVCTRMDSSWEITWNAAAH